ncbi:MAG: hypothetical protein AAGA23_06015 [Pseudomonadota bacterium]
MANDALILLVIMLGCIGLSMLICYLVWGRATKFLNNELATLRTATDRELAELAGQRDVLQTRQQEDQATASSVVTERDQLEEQVKKLTEELRDATGQLAQASNELVNQKLVAETAQKELARLRGNT